MIAIADKIVPVRRGMQRARDVGDVCSEFWLCHQVRAIKFDSTHADHQRALRQICHHQEKKDPRLFMFRTKILTLKSRVLLLYLRFHKIHIREIEYGKYSCLTCYPRTCLPSRVPEIECPSKFSFSKSYQAQTSHHETKRYRPIAPT